MRVVWGRQRDNTFNCKRLSLCLCLCLFVCSYSRLLWAHISDWCCPLWSSPWPRAPQTWPTWPCSGSLTCPAPPSRPCTPCGQLAALNHPQASASVKSATGKPGVKRSIRGGEFIIYTGSCFKQTLFWDVYSIHCVKAKRDTICSAAFRFRFSSMSSRQIKTLLDS